MSKLRIPLDWDPNSNVFLAVAAPTGGILNHPALVKGDDGDTPNFDEVVDMTVLEYDDVTPDFMSLNEIAPNVYQLVSSNRKGPKGDDGTMVLDVDAYGTPIAGSMIVLNPTANAFVYQAQKVGGRYTPATIANVPSGNPGYTLCPISVPPQPFDWRPKVEAQTVVTPTGADVRVDILARLQRPSTVNGETAGNVVARGFGIAGLAPPTLILSGGPPAGSADDYDVVLEGEEATIWVRTERQAGSGTYTTSSATSWANVFVEPVP